MRMRIMISAEPTASHALDKTEGSENNPDTLLNAGAGSWLSLMRATG
ncbi:MAG: hypothetical protein MZV63_00300 [Marinilabiliales bacterium]|nr:hypothetical protein [Marinilabiliales bacterium]